MDLGRSQGAPLRLRSPDYFINYFFLTSNQRCILKKPKRVNKPRRRRRSTQPSNPRGPFFTDPLPNLDPGQRLTLAAALATNSREQFNRKLSELTELADSVSPLHILSMLACYALMAPIRAAARAGNRPVTSTRVQQGHVEFFQALVLRKPPNCDTPPDPSLSQLIFDALPDLFEAHGLMQMPFEAEAHGQKSSSNEQAAIQFVQSFLRGHTASVRNWGYFSAVTRIATELFSVLDDDFRQEYGLTLTESIALFEHLIRRLEKQISEKYLHRLQRVYAAGTPAAMAEAIDEQFSELQGIGELATLLRQPSTTRHAAKTVAIRVAEWILPKLFIFSSDEIANELSLDASAVGRLLDRLSLAFGALGEHSPEKIILENPVWRRPLIKLEDGTFFCALPQVLTSFVVSIIDELIEPFPAWQRKVQKKRAAYLEDQAERLMREAFPGCELVRGYKWKEGGVQYESDLALRFDSTIFLVESKSGRVSWPALRGRPDRIIRDVNELIVRPSDQSGRLALRLREAISGVTDCPVHDFPLRLENVGAIVRLSVVLQDFATIQSIPTLMTDAGLIKSEYRLAPCLTLPDLEVITDILDTPYLRMHYLRRRAELLPSAPLIGHELDTLGFYLDTGLNLGEAETGSQQLVMAGYSARVDRYYVHRDEGAKTKKPRVNISAWIRSLCEQLAGRQSPGWSEIAFHLLCIPPDDQRRVEKELRARQRKIASGKSPKDGHNALVLTPPEHRRVGLVFYVHLPNGETSLESARRFASIAFDAEHVELCVVMGFADDTSSLLYRSVALMYRTDRQVQVSSYL